ncbi:hypothetical protein [Methanoregula sp. UBA64]|uniref:hypothetical protein n=1 Tax=Methanoregula sp. UBA64 TaxID=1915554 RepID=UPI0025F53842|nr:hypothetical protein [Methanoregula sp. UBA64]
MDQTQVDTIASAASADDPDLKLKNLEQEVDLIKTSIKRLLIDIRERMNEFQSAGDLAAFPQNSVSSAETAAKEAGKAALDAREVALEARKTQLDAAEDAGGDPAGPPGTKEPDTAARSGTEEAPVKNKDASIAPPVSRADLVLALKASRRSEPEKPGLQKVFRLFSWTDKAVKKYGQDRLEILLESYRVMGHLPVNSKEEILGIVRLIPEDLGTSHTISADEYVSELYSLRRILVPDDISLDRDMIAVLMEQRRQAPPGTGRQMEGEDSLHESGAVAEKPGTIVDKSAYLEWMNLHS